MPNAVHRCVVKQNADPPQVTEDDKISVRQVIRMFIKQGAWLPLLVLLIYGIGMSVDFSRSPKLVKDAFDGDGDKAKNYALIASGLKGLLVFLLGPLMGQLSDKWGRKWFLIVSVILTWIATFALALHVWFGLSIYWYFGGYTLTGVIDALSPALAQIADLMPPEMRAASFGFTLAAFGVGVGLFPLLCTPLSNHLVFPVVLVLMLVGIALSAVYSKETIRTSIGEEVNVNPFKAMKILNRDGLFRNLASIVFVSNFVSGTSQTLGPYFFQDNRGFNQLNLNIFIAILGLALIIVQVALVQPLINTLGEKKSLMYVFVFGALGQVGYGVSTADTNWIIYLCAIAFSLCSIAFPVISSLKSNNASDDEQGAVQGALASVQNFGAAMGPFTLGLLINVPMGWDGWLWMIAGFLYLLCSLLSYYTPLEGVHGKMEAKRKLSQHLSEPLLEPEVDPVETA